MSEEENKVEETPAAEETPEAPAAEEKAAPAPAEKKPAAAKKAEEPAGKRTIRKTRVGVVVSDGMNKTIVVKITRRVPHPRFKKIVKSGRPEFREDPEALDKIATGQIFSAELAQETGLVNQIGFIEDAVSRVIELGASLVCNVLKTR